MNENQDHDEVRRVLKDALPPVASDLRRDLWPMMQRRLDAQEPRVDWYDWAWAAVVGGVIVVFPDLFLVLLYHL